MIFGKSIYRQIEPDNKNWIAVTPLAIMPINWLPEGVFYDLLSYLNNKIFLRAIRRVIRDHKLRNYILFNSFNPFYGYSLPPSIKPAVSLYQSRDNIMESEYLNRHGPRLEHKVAQSANIRLATSTELVNILSTPSHPFIFFPNAADFDLFIKASEPIQGIPEELSKLKRPIIGYMGNICLRLDYELLYKIAIHFKWCTLLMVGPRDDDRHHRFNFDELENVVFTGGKNIVELPKYLSVMNCAILPFKKNALTRSIYPLKINEYLAGGKPVVSTDFSPDIKSFKDFILISESHEDFIAKLDTALADVDSERKRDRISEARKNSWTGRVELFWEIINKYQSA
ncbi:MAG: glycosyltransferase [Cyclobacteriaceae bacterium]